MIDWINTVENTTIESICYIEKKKPVEIISDPSLKAKLIKMMSEIIRVGHFINIDFPENFINNSLRKASMINSNINIDVKKCISEIEFIVSMAQEKKININQNNQILNDLKTQNG